MRVNVIAARADVIPAPPAHSYTNGARSPAVTPAASDAPQRGGSGMDLAVLDALRGTAALYVMLGHASGLLWAGYHDYAGAGGHGLGLVAAFLAHHLLRWGHQAVLLFFLISGFCIHYRQAKQLARRSEGGNGPHTGASGQPLFDGKSYAWRRLRRLYPTLLVALAITALFDFIGARVNPGFYAGTTAYDSINQHLGGGSHSLSTLVGNLLFQGSFAVPAFGTNGPLWSLSFEFWFYVLYPVLLVLSMRLGPRRMIAAAAGVSALALLALPRSFPAPGDRLVPLQTPAGWIPWWVFTVLAYWLVWCGGALIAEAYVGRIRLRGFRWLAPFAAAGLALLALNYRYVTARPEWWQASSDLVWGTGFGVLLAGVILATPRRLGGHIERAARRLAMLGDLSYSLYVVHLPWLALLCAWWLSSHRTLPLGPELAVFGAVSSLTLSWCCWYLVERHCISRPAARRAPLAVPLEAAALNQNATVAERLVTPCPPEFAHNTAGDPWLDSPGRREGVRSVA